jgi:hypothetical protein
MTRSSTGGRRDFSTAQPIFGAVLVSGRTCISKDQRNSQAEMMTNNFQSMFADCGFDVELFHWLSFGSLRAWQHCGADSVEGKYQQQKDMLTSNLYKSRCHCGKMHDGHPAWCRIDTVHVSTYDCGPNIGTIHRVVVLQLWGGLRSGHPRARGLTRDRC